MPTAEEKRRGGVKYYRTIKTNADTSIRIAIVPKAGKRGGHTVAGKPHHCKHCGIFH